jgi:hypothetical protein
MWKNLKPNSDGCISKVNEFSDNSLENIIWRKVVKDTIIDYLEIDRWIARLEEISEVV